MIFYKNINEQKIGEIMQNIQGECPICGGTSLNYEDNIRLGYKENTIYRVWKCGDCAYDGREFYSIEFLKHDLL